MFARGIAILARSNVDVGNIPVPRPWDTLVERCGQEAMRALAADLPQMTLSQRLAQPERWAEIQRARREQLETFLWVEPNAAALERMLDLISLICTESHWSRAAALFDDPARPEIDLQAAETGVLLGWILRRHGQKLAERVPHIQRVMVAEVRWRLLSPLSVNDDYPFLRGEGRYPALILSDLLTACLLLERNPSRRQQSARILLRQLDGLCTGSDFGEAPLGERLADACALADLARLLKRYTRGELDLTGEFPPPGWLDGVLVPWLGGDYFFDPVGEDMQPELSGMDLFRLGYMTRDRALTALGAHIGRGSERPCFSLNGRVLSMEYMRAAKDEANLPPRLKRAEAGGLLVSRVDALCAALACSGARSNAGDIALFSANTPILADAGGLVHNLPLIAGCAPAVRCSALPIDADFGEERDLMSIDLTDAYPEGCPLAAYQRTLIVMQRDGTVRLVDAFEFTGPARALEFRFIAAQRPEPTPDGVRLGPVTLSWDRDMRPDYIPLPAGDAFSDGCYLLRFLLNDPPARLICGFTFEAG